MESSSQSWWGWIQDTGAAAASALKEDLQEVASTVSADTSHVAEVASESAFHKVSEVSAYLDHIDEATEVQGVQEDGPERVRQTWLLQPQRQLRCEKTTFTVDPAASADAMMYVEWLEVEFVFVDRTEEMKELLRESPEMLKLHLQLVPEHLSNDTFWTRYFWQCRKLELDAERRAALVERAVHEAEEEEEGWGDWEEDEPIVPTHVTNTQDLIGAKADVDVDQQDQLQFRPPSHGEPREAACASIPISKNTSSEPAGILLLPNDVVNKAEPTGAKESTMHSAPLPTPETTFGGAAADEDSSSHEKTTSCSQALLPQTVVKSTAPPLASSEVGSTRSKFTVPPPVTTIPPPVTTIPPPSLQFAIPPPSGVPKSHPTPPPNGVPCVPAVITGQAVPGSSNANTQEVAAVAGHAAVTEDIVASSPSQGSYKEIDKKRDY